MVTTIQLGEFEVSLLSFREKQWQPRDHCKTEGCIARLGRKKQDRLLQKTLPKMEQKMSTLDFIVIIAIVYFVFIQKVKE
jgi:hypothetical protein